MIKPLPVISRNVPAFASSEAYPARNANDPDYGTEWRSRGTPAWLAYDLSAVPPESRRQVAVVYYNGTSGYDHALLNNPGYNNPAAYTIEANRAPGGGKPPDTGWISLVTVVGNTYHSRQHIFDLAGNNWIRMHVTASDGSDLNRDVALNMDVHDASAGVEDDWIFYGDSITAAAMDQTPRGAGTFAQQIDAMTKHFPIQENGGIPSLTSRDGVNHIRQWLGLFPGTYVALSYGTNDAGWGIPPQDFYNNYVGMVRAVLQAGKIPVIPTIPWGRTANIQKNGPGLNAKIDELYRTFPQVIRGPDLWAYFAQHPSLISSDGIHPTDEGFAAYRRQWVEDVVSKIY